MLSPYFEIFYKTNSNFEYKSVTYVCQKHIECGPNNGDCCPFLRGNTVRKSDSFNTINAVQQLLWRDGWACYWN